jgi:hypothetical protein
VGARGRSLPRVGKSISAIQFRGAYLVWTGASEPATAGLGTNSVFVPGANVTLTLDLVIGIDSSGLSAYGAAFEFDTDGANELDIVDFQELSWANAKATRRLVSITVGLHRSQESQPGGPEGQLFAFEAVALPLRTGPTKLTLTMARMVFATTPALASDGFDIFATNEQDPGDNVVANNANEIVTFPLPSASVNLEPEPATAVMLGLGLAALAASARRGRRG